MFCRSTTSWNGDWLLCPSGESVGDSLGEATGDFLTRDSGGCVDEVGVRSTMRMEAIDIDAKKRRIHILRDLQMETVCV